MPSENKNRKLQETTKHANQVNGFKEVRRAGIFIETQRNNPKAPFKSDFIPTVAGVRVNAEYFYREATERTDRACQRLAGQT